ncbi:MAG: iron-sulfur cluster carrier protein ApbC [Proteobacteria bacterium]|jgi:ATP-binding protein involved in chromosome partitioning|nr:iron-sulfur cluster carrier protein ApbC [Pseudomonadota bacterium]
MDLKKKLETVRIPLLDRSLADLSCLESAELADGIAKVTLKAGFHLESVTSALESALLEALADGTDGEAVNKVELTIDSEVVSQRVQGGLSPLRGVKNMIAIASGKGGVGKSTVTANLAVSLAMDGAAVGVLDADVYGPSQPRMFGVSGKPEFANEQMFIPPSAHGVKIMSSGLMVDEETPMIWRGPMVTQALDQLLNQTVWGELDYLLIDLPPGTGDTQLSLSQKVPVSGSIIVTTPQDIALLDARRAYRMFEKVEIPVLGVIENMSTHVCSECGHEEHIFGQGGGEKMAQDYGLEFLVDVPLDIDVRIQADEGTPVTLQSPESTIGIAYRTAALKIAAALAKRRKDYSKLFPKIVVEN